MEDNNALDVILEKELDLFNKINTVQLRVREAVTAREWVDFELLNAKILSIGGEIDVLEEKRLALDGKVESQATQNLKRQVKAAIYRAQWTSDAVARYIDEQRLLTAAFIEAIYPEKRGTIYSRYGKRAAADMRSIVLDGAY
jgi:hypothetical protein